MEARGKVDWFLTFLLRQCSSNQWMTRSHRNRTWFGNWALVQKWWILGVQHAQSAPWPSGHPCSWFRAPPSWRHGHWLLTRFPLLTGFSLPFSLLQHLCVITAPTYSWLLPTPGLCLFMRSPVHFHSECQWFLVPQETIWLASEFLPPPLGMITTHGRGFA